ncbi:hypothetical protein E2C01_020041 [Portunus trituberculatus]|uniref:Uncharacterized protein n=1 Tax=Portunus trituberculatus TaxID=210409 RepID=A0A5B7DZ57_PORTR|nr:hypothetical protein [Portunus trituberculatus]
MWWCRVSSKWKEVEWLRGGDSLQDITTHQPQHPMPPVDVHLSSPPMKQPDQFSYLCGEKRGMTPKIRAMKGKVATLLHGSITRFGSPVSDCPCLLEFGPLADVLTSPSPDLATYEYL